MKRCNHFDDEGNPRHFTTGLVGCIRATGQCRFIHPDEPEWAQAKSSQLPPRLTVVNKSSDYYTDRGRSRSPPRRHSSDTKHYRKHSPEYRSSKSTKRDPDSRSISPSRRDSMSYSRRRSRSPVASSSRDRRRSFDDAKRSQDADSNIFGSRREEHTIPEPPASPPLVPPPPLPEPPSFIAESGSTPDLASKYDLTAEQKNEIWLGRIKLISDVTNHRRVLAKLEDDLESMRKLSKSSRYPNLSDDDKAHLDKEVSVLEQECKDKKRELNTTIESLMATNFWPTFHPPDMKGAEEKFQSVKKVVTELRDAVTEIDRDLHTIIADRNARKSSQDKIQVPADPDQPPNKRRRTGENGEIRIFEDDQVYSLEDFVKARESLVHLEGQIEELKNSLLQRTTIISDEIKDAIDARWEDFGPPHVTGGDDNKLQELESNVNITGEQLGELAEEVGKLMIRDSDILAETTRLKEENARIEGTFAGYESNLQEMKEQLARNKKETDALSAALTAYLARPPSPPPVPPQEYILQLLEQPIQSAIRANLRPLLDNFRTDVESMLKTHNQEVYGTLWAKVKLTMRTIDAIARKVEQEQVQNGIS